MALPLGCFSVSLAVKDIAASRKFYEMLGFTVYAGNQDQRWLIMKNGETNVGLFQGMFEKNTLTFNPGWDNGANPIAKFTDIRDIKAMMKQANIPIVTEAGGDNGPAHFIITDPDGNPILFDQHVNRPE